MITEKEIIVTLLRSTEHLRQVVDYLEVDLIESSTARILLKWILEYYTQYREAPNEQIWNVYQEKVKADKVSEEVADELEHDIIPELLENETFSNLEFFEKEVLRFINIRKTAILEEELSNSVGKYDLETVQELIRGFSFVEPENKNEITSGTEGFLRAVTESMQQTNEVLIHYPGALGQFINAQLVRGGFVAFLAPEKRGKTYILMELSLRGVLQSRNVAFFQAGDMTESQFLERVTSYVSRRPLNPEKSGKQYVPVHDCLFNLTGECVLEARENTEALFFGKDIDEVKYTITRQEFENALREQEDYSPCTACSKRRDFFSYQKRMVPNPLVLEDAVQFTSQFFQYAEGKLKIATYANGALSISKIEERLAEWEEKEGFVADIIIIDYADLIVNNKRTEFRHQQNQIWKDMRGLSQKKNCLLITATQADAKSYEKDTLNLSNFSEDKRKFAHVTAMYGLNQDPGNREKDLGILRINELLLRKKNTDKKQVYIVQNLDISRPIVGSFF